MQKRYYRSKKDRRIAGVCGGIGEYFNIDPVFIRVAAIALVFAGGIGLIAYFTFWIAAPENPKQ